MECFDLENYEPICPPTPVVIVGQCEPAPPDPPITVDDCDGNPVEVEQIVGIGGKTTAEICNWDEMPLGIEAALAPVGCLTNEDGEITGKVFLCKVVDEETGIATFEKRLENTDGTFVQPYTGAWEDCIADCPTVGSVGTISSWAAISG